MKVTPKASFAELSVEGATFVPQSQLGDGNCLFRSTNALLGLGDYKPQQRDRLADFYLSHQAKLGPLFRNEFVSATDAAAYIKRDYNYATPVEIVGLSLLLNVNVISISPHVPSLADAYSGLAAIRLLGIDVDTRMMERRPVFIYHHLFSQPLTPFEHSSSYDHYIPLFVTRMSECQFARIWSKVVLGTRARIAHNLEGIGMESEVRTISSDIPSALFETMTFVKAIAEEPMTSESEASSSDHEEPEDDGDQPVIPEPSSSSIASGNNPNPTSNDSITLRIRPSHAPNSPLLV